MSGRPKQDEAEALRELIREAHEAIKDLRLAVKEVRAERAEHAVFMDKTLRLAAAAGIEQVGAEAQKALDFVQGSVDQLVAHLSALLGATSAEEFGDEIVKEAAKSLAAQLMVALDDHARPVITTKKQRGEVFVTTDPALAPPGSIIIDGR